MQFQPTLNCTINASAPLGGSVARRYTFRLRIGFLPVLSSRMSSLSPRVGMQMSVRRLILSNIASVDLVKDVGLYQGRRVALKCLRVSTIDDPKLGSLQKASLPLGLFKLAILTFISDILQGSCNLEKIISP